MKFAARVLAIVVALSACAVAVHVLLNHQGVSPVNYRAAGLGAVSSLGGEPSDPFIGYFTGHWCDCWRKANLPPIEEMKLYEGVLPRAICPAQAKVVTLNTDGMTPQEKFLAQVFVGLVNRRAPLWYLVEKDDFWYRGRRAPWRVGIAGEPFKAPYGQTKEMSAEVGYRVDAKDFLWGLKRFYNELVPIMIKGVVIYDPALLDPNAKPSHPRALLNVIRTLCAVEQALPVTPELYEKLTRAKVENPSLGDRTPLPVFLDTRTRKDWMISSYNGDEKEAESRLYTWAFNNLWKNCDHHAVCFIPPVGSPSPGNDLTDYAVQFKLFCFHAGDETKGDERLIEYVLGQSPMNIPVVGSLSWETGEKYLADRTRLLRLFSRFGKFFIDFADAPNVSFHSGTRYSQRTTYRQKPIRFRQLDPAKTYVSFVLTNGNSLGRLMSARAVHWDHASRGSLPVAWSLPLAAADACPNILTYYYNTATENDYFVADFSGVGEMFPSVYGAVTKDRMQLLASYLKETDKYMGYMDLKELWVEQSDPETESAFLEGLSNLQAMLYGKKAARSYLPKSSFMRGQKAVFCTFVDLENPKQSLTSLKEQMSRFPEKFLVVGLDETAFSPDEDVVAEILRAAQSLGDGVEVVRLDELQHLHGQAVAGKLVDASPPVFAEQTDARGSLEVARVSPGAIRVDGQFDDWRKIGIRELDLAPAATPQEISTPESKTPRGKASVAYDDRFLYISVEVEDVSPFVDDYNLAAGDSVVLLLDTRSERFREPVMTEGYYRLHVVPAVGLLEKPSVLFGYPTFDLDLVSNNRNGIEEEAVSKTTPGGYVLEAAIPLLNFPYLRWERGATLRFAIAVNDADRSGRVARLSSSGKDAMSNPLFLSDAVLR
jgi:hypothetical protein